MSDKNRPTDKLSNPPTFNNPREPNNPGELSGRGEFSGSSSRIQFFRKHRWLPLVLPMAVFLLTGLLESAESTAQQYPLAYTIRIAATLAAVFFALPYYRTVPIVLSRWAIPAGLLGGVIWIGICRSGLANTLLSSLGLSSWLELGARTGFNPLEELGGSMTALIAFLAVRFLGLVLLVPLIEEFFLRGFLMRFFDRSDWWVVPLGNVTRMAAGMATLYGVLSHPAEPLAAIAWFSLITLLYARTRNIWDCVLAHACTNLILGIYVLIWKDWELW